ncbi:hypothetical protein Dda_5699 [Drechslerella dactyloides]|uniref:FAD-binding domain-containing protein n=1 Tax=Drechslerella dactyloides TaxID=74499 RepID=A0AAD6IWQ0_DREDA|nr:hypothetical protein Dda_5699 [Drechslerella dactyloides]
MKVILTGVTGYLGPEVVRQCIANTQITSIVTLARRDLAPEFENEKKIIAIKVDDFGEYSEDVIQKMDGAVGCIWMMGTTPKKAAGIPRETLKKINIEWPSQSAKTFSTRLSPPPSGAKFRFIYTSGFLAPGPEVLDKNLWFAEETRKTRVSLDLQMFLRVSLYCANGNFDRADLQSWTEKYILDVEKEGRLEAIFAKPAMITNGEPLMWRLLGGKWVEMPATTHIKSNKANAVAVVHKPVDAITDLYTKSGPTISCTSVPASPAFDFSKRAWREFRASTPLNVLVIGAGMGGLASAIGLRMSGHTVTVFEAVSDIKDVGAGIQVAPNASRILDRFGVLDELKKDGIMLQTLSLRRWEDDAEIGRARLMPAVGNRYNAPLMVAHRADLQRALLNRALALGVTIRTAAVITAITEDFSPRVQLASGEWVSGDVVIAADGVKSFVREEIAKRKGYQHGTMSTGDAAYRILIDEERMKGDEKALRLLKGVTGSRWMGPGGHIMAYPLRSNKLYNMVLIHPIRLTQKQTESWTSRGTKAGMLKTYAGWNSTVRHLLSYVPDGEVMEWTLNSHAPLPSWVENKFVLVGDACHPMLPYVAQGAANAIEDAAVLTVALGLIKSKSGIDDALQVYQTIRKARGEAIQASARETQRVLHLPDGREQEERDRKIRDSFGIVAAGTFLGEVGTYYAFKGFLRHRAEKEELRNLNYASLATVTREGGIWFVFIARLSAIPSHLTTAVFSTCGISVWAFLVATFLSLPKQAVMNDPKSGKTASNVVLAITFAVTIFAAAYVYWKMRQVRPRLLAEAEVLRNAAGGYDVDGETAIEMANRNTGSQHILSDKYDEEAVEIKSPITFIGDDEAYEENETGISSTGISDL